MKSVSIVILLHSALWCEYSTQHIVIKLDGQSEVGLIDSMNLEHVYINSGTDQHKIVLKEVYYIYNTEGKLFYISPSYRDRLDLIEERSGYVITIQNDTLLYQFIEVDRIMDSPYVYLYDTEKNLTHKIRLFDLHLIKTDGSYMEHSVRRGTITATSIVLTGMLFQTFSYYSDRSDQLSSDATLLNKAFAFGGAIGTMINNFIPQGQQYESLIVFYPLASMGWMTYDYIFDKRTHFFRTFARDEKFPRTMYWFNPRRIIREKTDQALIPVKKYWGLIRNFNPAKAFKR